MKETIIILYIAIMQLNIAAITRGILTYLRYKKESLRYFILIISSLQMIQIGLLLTACADYSGKITPLFDGMMKFFDVVGTTALLFSLSVFPFFMTGRKPGKLIKLLAALMALIFLMNTFASLIQGAFIFPVINKVVIAVVFLAVFITIITSLGNMGNAIKGRAIGYLIGMSIIFLPLFLRESVKDHFSLIHSFSLPAYLLMACCGGLLLIKTYFNVPFYINPESGKLSEYFIQKFNITEREAEIIMLLRKGRAYKEIAEELVIAYKTVDAHIQNIYSKTGVNRRKQLLNLMDTSSI